MIAQTVCSIVNTAQPSREDFNNPMAMSAGNAGWNAATMLITLIIMIVIVALVGYWLWNTCVAGAGKNDTGLFTFAKRADNVWQILGLFILLSLLCGSCCPMVGGGGMHAQVQ